MEDKSITVIKPVKGWFNIDIKSLFKKKDLIFLFVKRNFVSNYKQTILGPLWALIQPLLTTVVFTIVFGKIANLSSDGAPQFLFYMSGNIAWSYFSNCISSTSGSFINNAGLLKKVYFPRLVMPVSSVITGFISYLIQVAMFICFGLYYYFFTDSKVSPNLWILLIPVLIIMMVALGLGFGIIVSAVTTKYRDLQMLVSFGIQLWLYGSPVAYGTTMVPDKLLNLYMLNPMAPIISAMRYGTLGCLSQNLTEAMLVKYLIIAAITIAIILFIGIILFSRVEKTFADTV